MVRVKNSLAIISVVLSVVSLSISTVSMFGRENSTKPIMANSQKPSATDSKVTQAANAEKVRGNEVNVKYTCWVDSPMGCGGDSWEWNDLAAGRSYTLKLGDPDSDGEIRRLTVRNAKGETKDVGELPKGLTYVSSYSEFDGRPFNSSPVNLAMNGNYEFRIEAYLASAPVSVFDSRLPVLVKYVSPGNGF